MKWLVLILIVLAVSGWGGVQLGGGVAPAGGGGCNAAFCLVDDANCQGAWLIFDGGAADQVGAENDACTGGTLDMTFNGATFAVAADEPEGTPAAQDAVNFNGTDQYFALADNAALEARPFTLGCWVQHAHASQDYIFEHGFDGEWGMWDIGTGSSAGNVDGGRTATTATTTPQSDWFHITMRYETGPANNVIFYNGTEDGNDSTGFGTSGTAGDIRIGTFSNSHSGVWLGDIMECWYVDRELTDVEIETVFLCGADGNADGNARDALTNAPACVEGTHGCCV